MKHNTIHGYFSDLSAIHRKARDAYTNIWEQWHKADGIYQDAMADRTISDARRAAGKEVYHDALRERKKLLSDIQESTEKELSALELDFVGFLDERYAADPGQLDMAAMALLNSGIMSTHELSIMADKFEGNDTMRRVIASYAEKIPNDREARLLSVSLNRNKRAEQESAFDALVMMIKKTIQDSEYAAEGMEKHWDEIYGNAIDSLN